ncbi:MAG: UDP-N-acetylmuramate dehydrogenase [Arcobacteraceae bacterium]|nr:UDP-N-acetylmuramate dehydrogenase [Arcobacteraceae bacterium]
MTKTIDFKKYTSINIGGKHQVKVINNIGNFSKYTIIGRGNNLLISDNPPPLAVLGDEFDYIIQKGDKLIVGASTSSGKLLTYCRKHDIANFELLAKLPGNIGGLVKMNAGLKQWEIFNHLHSIKTQDGNILKKDIPHTYRHTNIKGIIYEVTFDIEQGFNKEQQNMFVQMRDNQPNLPSAGSCFKNPKEHSAGYLIEKVGLKGYVSGGMAFSSIHANFLVNMGSGTYDEAIKLINLAKQKVKEEFNIDLEEEIIVL